MPTPDELVTEAPPVPTGRSSDSPSGKHPERPVLFLSAGEASGEHYGALLIGAIRRLAPASSFFGLGGPRMAALGLDRIVRAEDVAHMGITEIVRHAPYIYAQYRKLKASVATRKPDLAILIDFPDVNLRLARELHRRGIPVLYFVSPQLWAWKKRRIRRVRRYVSRMLVIFPFEEPFYRKRAVPAEFVGHPLADLPPPSITREQFASEHDLDPAKHWIGLLPGSRMRELALNLPEIVAAANKLGPGYQYLLPVAHTLRASDVAAALVRLRPAVPIRLTADARATLHHARASVVASGTATVEAALIGNPFVVVYRLSPLSYAVARRVVKVPHVAMPNLLAGRKIVPELIQGDLMADALVQSLAPLLIDSPERARMVADLAELRATLRVGNTCEPSESAIDRVARISLSLI